MAIWYLHWLSIRKPENGYTPQWHSSNPHLASTYYIKAPQAYRAELNREYALKEPTLPEKEGRRKHMSHQLSQQEVKMPMKRHKVARQEIEQSFLVGHLEGFLEEVALKI